MADVDTVAALRERLARQPADRYPVQHATGQFHLGAALLRSGEAQESAAALRRAAELFGGAGLDLERAKARNLLGVALRERGDPRAAAHEFAAAAEEFAALDAAGEQGAARYNLGLARAQLGDRDAAKDAFAGARQLLEDARAVGQASAAARELGALQFSDGDLEAATATLEDAVALADRAADLPALGAAANVLGLVHLTGGRIGAALAAFDVALGGYPRTVRPEGHAMVKANLALAWEQAGDHARARLAARQALGLRAAPAPVRAQAAALLERLGRGDGDLPAVLEDEPAERWQAVLGDEVARWLALPAPARRAELAGWVEASAGEVERAFAWLAVLLELPPGELDTMVRSCLEALGERRAEDAQAFRGAVSRAMVRFHGPQWMRIKDIHNRIAVELGQEPAWG